MISSSIKLYFSDFRAVPQRERNSPEYYTVYARASNANEKSDKTVFFLKKKAFFSIFSDETGKKTGKKPKKICKSEEDGVKYINVEIS